MAQDKSITTKAGDTITVMPRRDHILLKFVAASGGEYTLYFDSIVDYFKQVEDFRNHAADVSNPDTPDEKIALYERARILNDVFVLTVDNTFALIEAMENMPRILGTLPPMTGQRHRPGPYTGMSGFVTEDDYDDENDDGAEEDDGEEIPRSLR